MNDMLTALLADLLITHLSSAKLGVQVLGFAELDASTLTTLVAEVTARLKPPVYWCFPEVTPDSVPLGVALATTIEQAVAWRNTPDCAGRIVVVVADDLRLPKLHSLADFDILTPASVRKALVQQMARHGPAEIRPFWEAFEEYAVAVPLDDLMAYARASRDVVRAHKEVWRVGFLADEDLFLHPAQQLARQRAMLTEAQRLSKPVHTRMLRVVAKADAPQRVRVQHTYQHLMAYVNSGRSEHLQGLQFGDVAWLVHTSKASTDPARPAPVALRSDISSAIPKPTTKLPAELSSEHTFVMQLPKVLQAYRAQAWYHTGALQLVWCRFQNQSPSICALLPYVESGFSTGLEVAVHSIGQHLSPLVLDPEVEAACERGTLKFIEQHFATIADWWSELLTTSPHILIASAPNNEVLHQWFRGGLDATWFAIEFPTPLPEHEMPEALLLAHAVTPNQSWYVWTGKSARVSLALYKHARTLHLPLDLAKIEYALQTLGPFTGDNGLTLIRAPYSAEGTKAALVILQRINDWLGCDNGT